MGSMASNSSAAAECSACHKSQFRWPFSQNSAERAAQGNKLRPRYWHDPILQDFQR